MRIVCSASGWMVSAGKQGGYAGGEVSVCRYERGCGLFHPVVQVLAPYFEGEKPLYQELLARLEEKRIPVETMPRDRLFTYGDLDIRVFPPEKFHYNKSNDYSLAVLVKHGDIHLFYAGDAEKQRLGELLKLDLPTIDVYKTAHHGRNSKRGVELIEALKPEYAVVTAQEPENEIREAFKENGTQVYTTVNRDVVFVSDGAGIWPVLKE